MPLRAAYLAVNTSAAGKASEARDKHKRRQEKEKKKEEMVKEGKREGN